MSALTPKQARDKLRKLDEEYFFSGGEDDADRAGKYAKGDLRGKTVRAAVAYDLATWLFDTGFGAVQFGRRMQDLITEFGPEMADEVMANVWHRNHDT